MKRFTKKRFLIFTGLCVLIFLSFPFYVKYKALHKIFANVENVKNKDFAIVLGAAIKDNNPPVEKPMIKTLSQTNLRAA